MSEETKKYNVYSLIYTSTETENDIEVHREKCSSFDNLDAALFFIRPRVKDWEGYSLISAKHVLEELENGEEVIFSVQEPIFSKYLYAQSGCSEATLQDARVSFNIVVTIKKE